MATASLVPVFAALGAASAVCGWTVAVPTVRSAWPAAARAGEASLSAAGVGATFRLAAAGLGAVPSTAVAAGAVERLRRGAKRRTFGAVSGDAISSTPAGLSGASSVGVVICLLYEGGAARERRKGGTGLLHHAASWCRARNRIRAREAGVTVMQTAGPSGGECSGRASCAVLGEAKLHGARSVGAFQEAHMLWAV